MVKIKKVINIEGIEVEIPLTFTVREIYNCLDDGDKDSITDKLSWDGFVDNKEKYEDVIDAYMEIWYQDDSDSSSS